MTTLVVPSAKFVGMDLRINFGPIPPVLVPLGGTVALRRIVDRYRDAVDRVLVLVDEGGDMVEDYLSFFDDPIIEVVRVTSGRSLADSIIDAARQHPELLGDSVVVNLGDTVVADLDLSWIGRDFAAYDHTDQTQRWTLFRQSGEEGTLEISDKKYQPDADTWLTFLGVWGFSQFGGFVNHLHAAASQPPTEVSAFYSAFRDHLATTATELVRSSSWIDYGHLDNLNSARKESMNLRSFNSLQFLHGGATVRKNSSNKAKLLDEIRWLLNQPRDLKVYTPTIYDQSLDPTSPYVEMEFYSYPSLDECFVYSRHDLDTWEQIFTRVFQILDLQREYSYAAVDLSIDLADMYVRKTAQRIDDFLESRRFDAQCGPTVNGRVLPSLCEVKEGLLDCLQQHGALTASEFAMSHGDLCFGNILYDAHHNLIKLIDPRGRFGRHTLYGDVYYDLAKLSHSVLGWYDFIIFDQVRVTSASEQSDAFEMSFRVRDYHRRIGEIFLKHVARNGYDVRRMRTIESTLFLSMLPLHADRPTRQQAMLFRGMQLFEEARS